MLSSGGYVTAGAVHVTRVATDVAFATALDEITTTLDRRRGALLASSYEYPGRYKRWSMGFVNPPLALESRADRFVVTALNERGSVLLPIIAAALATNAHLADVRTEARRLEGVARPPTRLFEESERSRQPSIFSVVRAIQDVFAAAEEPYLGLYGAFGYDLVHQFEPIADLKPRPADQRDLVLFLPDDLIVVDHERQRAVRYSYEFQIGRTTTTGLARDGDDLPIGVAPDGFNGGREYESGGYADAVRQAIPHFTRGDLFEVVPGQTFTRPVQATPSDLFRTLVRINPSPYGFFLNLGGADAAEYLIGASPEMFVRVADGRVETCPISGTIARGRDAVEDAERVRTLLNSKKDEAELTMCTDVDRNDKARVCVPGTVRVIGRRQIEMYSHLIHTVDHVEGLLKPGMDALDAFLSHMWAVTVTGAPKRAAIEFLERNERSARRWYGGAVGAIGFDGNLNTGLTLRTIRLSGGVAEVRVGATLLHDSVPEEEERETLVKGAAMFQALAEAEAGGGSRKAGPYVPARVGIGARVLMVDCEDSFVHTLASYIAATGAEVAVHRHGAALEMLDRGGWDLVVLSPGPGRPDRFGLRPVVRTCVDRGLPLFGVCLGLQAIGEAFGGALEVMPLPRHGKPSEIRVAARETPLFQGLPEHFTVGRYHSLRIVPVTLPDDLEVTAVADDDDTIMAIQHRRLPIAAVQFHPESIMSAAGGAGMRLVENAVAGLIKRRSASGEGR